MSSIRTRISTGVSELDPILGGLLIGDNVVWYDDAGSLAAVYCMNFLQVSQVQEKPFIYVSFDRSPRNLLEKLGPLADYRELVIMDCFTHGKGKSADIFLKFYEEMQGDWQCRIVVVHEPHDPEKVMDHFIDIHSGMKGDVRFVFESITGMQELWEGEEKISRFYSHTCPRLYELNTIGYWIMEKEAHSKRLKAAINQIAQVAIELFLKRGKTSLSILKAENRELEDANTPHPYAVKGFNITFDTKKHITSQIDLGKRVRDLRTKKGFSQTEIAKLVGVTPSNISQIESNQIYPSLTALYKIAETLGVDMSSLFQEFRDTRKEIVFSEADAVDIQIPDMPKGSVSARLLAPVDSETKVEPYLIEIPPGKSLSSHFFVHKGEEVGYMLSGKLQLKLENSTYTLHSGDVVHLITEMPSHWKNPGPGTVRMFWLKIK